MFSAGSRASRLLLTPLLLLLAQGCAPAPPPELPEALIGLWRTRDTRYAGRYFELREDQTVIFGQGGDDFTVGWIRSIMAREREPSVFVYDITYLDERRDEFAFDFVYDQRTDALHFQNQKQIEWSKDLVLPTADEEEEEEARRLLRWDQR